MDTTLHAPDTTVLDSLDFTINCGAPFHDEAGKGCTPGEPATHLMIAPCCGARLYVCQGRAHYLHSTAVIIHCSRCGIDHPNTAYRFTPIETP